MPGMDGLETAALVRTRDKSRLTPIIFLTAYEKTNIQIYKENRPSVVHITTLVQRSNFGGANQVPSGTGSGFIWTRTGTSSPTTTSSRGPTWPA